MRRENELEKDPAPLPKAMRRRYTSSRDNHNRSSATFYLREDLLARLTKDADWRSVSSHVEKLLLKLLGM